MFLPDMLTDEVVLEQMSPVGSGSPITVKPPFPSGMTPLPGLTVLMTPLVWPETRLMAPGVDGPKVVLKEWSFMA